MGQDQGVVKKAWHEIFASYCLGTTWNVFSRNSLVVQEPPSVNPAWVLRAGPGDKVSLQVSLCKEIC